MRKSFPKTYVMVAALALLLICCSAKTSAQRTGTQPAGRPAAGSTGANTGINPKLDTNKTPATTQPTKSVPAGTGTKIDTSVVTIPAPDLIVSDIAYTKEGLSDSVVLMVLVENQGTASAGGCNLWVRLNKPLNHKTFQSEFMVNAPALAAGEKKWVAVAIGDALTKDTNPYEKAVAVTAIIDAKIYPSEQAQAIVANIIKTNQQLVQQFKKPLDVPQLSVIPPKVSESNEQNNERTVALDKIKLYQP